MNPFEGPIEATLILGPWDGFNPTIGALTIRVWPLAMGFGGGRASEEHLSKGLGFRV